MRLIAEALAEQPQRLASQARSKAYAVPARVIARAALREQSERLAWLARELDPDDPVIVRCADDEGPVSALPHPCQAVAQALARRPFASSQRFSPLSVPPFLSLAR